MSYGPPRAWVRPKSRSRGSRSGLQHPPFCTAGHGTRVDRNRHPTQCLEGHLFSVNTGPRPSAPTSRLARPGTDATAPTKGDNLTKDSAALSSTPAEFGGQNRQCRRNAPHDRRASVNPALCFGAGARSQRRGAVSGRDGLGGASIAYWGPELR